MMGAPDDPAQAPDPGGYAGILRERDRIALGLQNEVIQRVFAIGLHLESAAAITTDPRVRRQLDHAIDDIDHVIRAIRDTVFDLEGRLKGRGLRAGIMHLCEQLSPVPDIAFRGPVDGALQPAASVELLEVLGDALAVIGRHWIPVLVNVTAADGAHVTVLQVVPLHDATTTGERDHEFAELHVRAAQAGMRIEIEPSPELVQISWHAA